jgi:2-aminoadipate transaminase
MQTALENPGIVSLAAGFVDQQSLPVELFGQVADDLFDDPFEGRRALQYGTTFWKEARPILTNRTRRPFPERWSRPARRN